MTDFNSLAPCGANPPKPTPNSPTSLFQLTRPVRGEPEDVVDVETGEVISTHSPRAGRTESNYIIADDLTHFNSLAPCGANPEPVITNLELRRFQLTRPVRGEPSLFPDKPHRNKDFNSLAPCGANRRVLIAVM